MQPHDRAERSTPVRISNWYPSEPTEIVLCVLRDAGYEVTAGSGWFEAVRRFDVDHDGTADDYESAAFTRTGVGSVLEAAGVSFDPGVAVYTIEAIDGRYPPLEFVG